MRILGLKELTPSVAQPLDDLLLRCAGPQATVPANLLSEGGQVPHPGPMLSGRGHEAVNDLQQKGE